MVTVSLFVAELAFGEETVGNDARLRVCVASLVAAFVGTAVMMPGEVDHDRSMDEHLPRTHRHHCRRGRCHRLLTCMPSAGR